MNIYQLVAGDYDNHHPKVVHMDMTKLQHVSQHEDALNELRQLKKLEVKPTNVINMKYQVVFSILVDMDNQTDALNQGNQIEQFIAESGLTVDSTQIYTSDNKGNNIHMDMNRLRT